jgi:hypothetical protein
MVSGKLRFAAQAFYDITSGTGKFHNWVAESNFKKDLQEELGVTKQTITVYMDLLYSIPIGIFPFFLGGHTSWTVFKDFSYFFKHFMWVNSSRNTLSKNVKFDFTTGNMYLEIGNDRFWFVNVYEWLIARAEEICKEGKHRLFFSSDIIKQELENLYTSYLKTITLFKESKRGGFYQTENVMDSPVDKYVRVYTRNRKQIAA